MPTHTVFWSARNICLNEPFLCDVGQLPAGLKRISLTSVNYNEPFKGCLLSVALWFHLCALSALICGRWVQSMRIHAGYLLISEPSQHKAPNVNITVKSTVSFTEVGTSSLILWGVSNKLRAEKWFQMPRVMFKPAYFCLDFLNISFLCPKLGFYHQPSSRWAWCSQVDATIPLFDNHRMKRIQKLSSQKNKPNKRETITTKIS